MTVVVRPPEGGGTGVEPVGRNVGHADPREVRDCARGRRGGRGIAHAGPAEQQSADAGSQVGRRLHVGVEVRAVDDLYPDRAAIVRLDEAPPVEPAVAPVLETQVRRGVAVAHQDEKSVLAGRTAHVDGRRDDRLGAGAVETADPVRAAGRTRRRAPLLRDHVGLGGDALPLLAAIAGALAVLGAGLTDGETRGVVAPHHHPGGEGERENRRVRSGARAGDMPILGHTTSVCGLGLPIRNFSRSRVSTEVPQRNNCKNYLFGKPQVAV